MRASCSRNVAHNQPCALVLSTPRRINTGNTPIYCIGGTAPSAQRYEVRACGLAAGRAVDAVRWQRAECMYALLPQCWAYRSLSIELNGSAVHAQFPDWPANESVPIVELMQLPVKTFGWVSRGINSSLASTTVSTDGIRTNCACAACAPADVCCARVLWRLLCV